MYKPTVLGEYMPTTTVPRIVESENGPQEWEKNA
jgi:hypothetical protein